MGDDTNAPSEEPEGNRSPDASSDPKAASNPEDAVDAAENALARVEALAGVDADSVDEPEPPRDADDSSTPAATDAPRDAHAPSDADPEPPSGATPDSANAPPSSSADSAALETPWDLVPDAARDWIAGVFSSGSTGADTEGDRGETGDGELPDQCPNCGALLEGPYCSQCGQKAENRIKPLWHMVNEVFEAIFELDLRVLHTLPKFLFLPGRLTKEYINGRRRRYIRPFRLYLFATFLLFTTLALTRPGNSPLASLSFQEDPAAVVVDTAASGGAPSRPALVSSVLAGRSATEQEQVMDALTRSLPDSIVARFRAGDSLQVDRFETWLRDQMQMPADSAVVDSSVFAQMDPQASSEETYFGTPSEREKIAQVIRDSLSIGLAVTADSAANAQIERLMRQKIARAVENPRDFVGALIDRMPYMMFLLLPVFALFLKLMYLRAGRLYMEHLIFTLHMHALAFFAFTAGVLMEEWGSPWVQEAGLWVLLSPFLYLFLAMQRVYEQSFLKTAFKTTLLLSVYLTVLVIGLLILAMLTVALL